MLPHGVSRSQGICAAYGCVCAGFYSVWPRSTYPSHPFRQVRPQSSYWVLIGTALVRLTRITHISLTGKVSPVAANLLPRSRVTVLNGKPERAKAFAINRAVNCAWWRMATGPIPFIHFNDNITRSVERTTENIEPVCRAGLRAMSFSGPR